MLHHRFPRESSTAYVEDLSETQLAHHHEVRKLTQVFERIGHHDFWAAWWVASCLADTPGVLTDGQWGAFESIGRRWRERAA
jgi:hypothetical protein